MKNILIGTTLLALTGLVNAAPVVYLNEADYLLDLATLGYISTHEGFEDNTVWADSRNSLFSKKSTPSITSKGVVWTSNFLVENGNEISTSDSGGDAPEGIYAIFSNPHGITTDSNVLLTCDTPDPIPELCYQNDGLKAESATGETLYGFGGRVDTTFNTEKITFLLDGVDIFSNDTDNIDNIQRQGESVERDIINDIWGFIGVIDTDGFLSAEIRELSGKDEQNNNLFADDFTIASSVTLVPVPAATWLFASGLLALIGFARRR